MVTLQTSRSEKIFIINCTKTVVYGSSFLQLTLQSIGGIVKKMWVVALETNNIIAMNLWFSKKVEMRVNI